MTQNPYAIDTSREAYEVQLELLRQMSPTERLKKTLSLSHQVRRMSIDAIRRRHPGFDENEVRLKFIELTYGTDLAREVKRWQKFELHGEANCLQEDRAIG